MTAISFTEKIVAHGCRKGDLPVVPLFGILSECLLAFLAYECLIPGGSRELKDILELGVSCVSPYQNFVVEDDPPVRHGIPRSQTISGLFQHHQR